MDEAILLSLGASWCEVADLDLGRLDMRLRARFRERARETVRDLDRHGSWVIKDPRLCLLFPFWREILERPLCVLIHREPLAVARSLAARDGLAIPYGIALWERYTREALASTRGLPRILVSHRELMADPEATLRRLYRHLVLPAPLPLLGGAAVPAPSPAGAGPNRMLSGRARMARGPASLVQGIPYLFRFSHSALRLMPRRSAAWPWWPRV